MLYIRLVYTSVVWVAVTFSSATIDAQETRVSIPAANAGNESSSSKLRLVRIISIPTRLKIQGEIRDGKLILAEASTDLTFGINPQFGLRKTTIRTLSVGDRLPYLASDYVIERLTPRSKRKPLGGLVDASEVVVVNSRTGSRLTLTLGIGADDTRRVAQISSRDGQTQWQLDVGDYFKDSGVPGSRYRLTSIQPDSVTIRDLIADKSFTLNLPGPLR